MLEIKTVIFALALNGIIGFLAWKTKKLDAGGALAGFAIGVTVFIFAGWQSFGLLLLFFLFGNITNRGDDLALVPGLQETKLDVHGQTSTVFAHSKELNFFAEIARFLIFKKVRHFVRQAAA